MLKADLHLHANEDKVDWMLKYSAKELIRHMHKQGFTTLALTFHDQFYYNQDIRNFARRYNMLLIPGTERTIEGKHILLYGINELPKVKTFEQLEQQKDNFTIVPAHPFFKLPTCIGKRRFKKWFKLWDAVEFSHYYSNLINFNKPTLKLKKDLPMIGNSDAHALRHTNHTFTEMDANNTVDDVLEAIRKNRMRIHTQPLSNKIWFDRARKFLKPANIINLYRRNLYIESSTQ